MDAGGGITAWWLYVYFSENDGKRTGGNQGCFRSCGYGIIHEQHGAAGDYKLLGGGVEPGEEYRMALCREVQEESGLIVIPESIRELGMITERRRDIFKPEEVYVCHSLFYICDVKDEMTAAHMTESEIAKGYHLAWATPQEILDGNATLCITRKLLTPLE